MSQHQLAVSPVKSTIWSLEKQFTQMKPSLEFAHEALFAWQILLANAYAMKVAEDNPDSVRSAVLNVAAIGLTLNPAQKMAYLVPRGGKICLDVSYIGLVKLATDTGSITAVNAEVVKSKDTFEYRGPYEIPKHKVDYFKDRGDTIGVYVTAKLSDRTILSSTPMAIDEVYRIRDRTEAWKAFKSGKTKSCPWFTDEEEMVKKTAIKRASKLWPKSERLNQAVGIINEHEGIDFEKERQPVKVESEPLKEVEKAWDLYDALVKLIDEKTAGMNLDQKSDWLEKNFGVLNIGELKKASSSYLQQCIDKLTAGEPKEEPVQAESAPPTPEEKFAADDVYARLKNPQEKK